MNGFLLMFCFLLPPALAHIDKKQVPNPADYTLNAEVVESYSRLQTVGGFPANV